MGDIRFSYNDDFNKTFLRPSQFVADRFLRCESMVFVVRKYGFSWVYVGILQFVRSVVADRQQHYRNPLAAVGVRFIVPAYMKKLHNEERTYVCGGMNIRI